MISNLIHFLGGNEAPTRNQLACLESASDRRGRKDLEFKNVQGGGNLHVPYFHIMQHEGGANKKMISWNPNKLQVKCDDRSCFFCSWISFRHDLISGQRSSKLIFPPFLQVGSCVRPNWYSHGVTIQASVELQMIQMVELQKPVVWRMFGWMLNVVCILHVIISCTHASRRNHRLA